MVLRTLSSWASPCFNSLPSLRQHRVGRRALYDPRGADSRGRPRGVTERWRRTTSGMALPDIRRVAVVLFVSESSANPAIRRPTPLRAPSTVPISKRACNRRPYPRHPYCCVPRMPSDYRSRLSLWVKAGRQPSAHRQAVVNRGPKGRKNGKGFLSLVYPPAAHGQKY